MPAAQFSTAGAPPSASAVRAASASPATKATLPPSDSESPASEFARYLGISVPAWPTPVRCSAVEPRMVAGGRPAA